MSGRLFPLTTLTTALVLGSMSAGQVHAQEVIATGAAKPAAIDEKLSLEQRLTALEGKVHEQQALLDQQEQTLKRQEALIDRQATALSWRALGGNSLEAARARGPDGAQGGATDTAQARAPAQDGDGAPVQLSAGQAGPVGEAPPVEPAQNLNAALPPEATGVLTRPGHFTLEPSFTYSLSSADRLVFRGVEIITESRSA